MTLWFVFFLLLLMFLLPFLPGMRELVKKEDADPLFIPMDYKRNPRYFGTSFRGILRRGMEGLSGEPGFYDTVLSKKEKLEITLSSRIASGEKRERILLVKGKLFSGSHVHFQKEILVTNNAAIGPHNVLQALASDGNVEISEGTVFHRWLDAEGDIQIDENCILGISVSSGSSLLLSRNCVFRRLYGMPIITGKPPDISKCFDQTPPYPSDRSFIRCNDRYLPTGTIMPNHVVFSQGIKIGPKSIIGGNIKSYGDIVLEEGATIYGNVIADGSVFVGRNVSVRGHIFSQNGITISRGTIISRPDRIKSVINQHRIAW